LGILACVAVLGLSACSTSPSGSKASPADLYDRLLSTAIPDSSLPPKVQFVATEAVENVSGAIGLVRVRFHDADPSVTDTLDYVVYGSDSEARNAYLLGKPVPCSPPTEVVQPCGSASLVAPSGLTGEAYCESPDNSPALCTVRDGSVVIEASSIIFTNNPGPAPPYIGPVDRAESLALAAESHLRALGG
jgi:hypothetical protein